MCVCACVCVCMHVCKYIKPGAVACLKQLFQLFIALLFSEYMCVHTDMYYLYICVCVCVCVTWSGCVLEAVVPTFLCVSLVALMSTPLA